MQELSKELQTKRESQDYEKEEKMQKMFPRLCLSAVTEKTDSTGQFNPFLAQPHQWRRYI